MKLKKHSFQASTEISANPSPTGGTVSTHNSLMEIKMAAQQMIARLKKYEPDNPNLTPGKKMLSK